MKRLTKSGFGLWKIVLTIALAVLFFAAFTAVVNAATIYVLDDYGTIQAAVNAANPGDTIIVRDGTYTENVYVNKSLTILSENGPDSTIVQAANPDDDVFCIAGHVVNHFFIWNRFSSISGFTIKGGNPGIGLHCSHSLISNNKINSNQVGIFVVGGGYNTIVNNKLSNNFNGIFLYSATKNTITKNTISSNNINILFLPIPFFLLPIDNSIYLNNFIKKNTDVSGLPGGNFWNSPRKITYFYNGNTYTNYLGNYWEAYTGSDADGDGIGDTHYSIPDSTNNDSYPLVERFENYEIGEDTTPPSVSCVSPQNGATDVAIDTVVTATFSEAMDSSTITTNSFTLAGSAVSGTVTYDPTTYTATFTPDADLEYNHEYTATLSTDITDEASNPLAEAYTWSFTTEPAPAPPPPDYFSEEWIEKVINWASAQEDKNYWYEHCMGFVSDAFKVCENRPGSANDLKDSLESAGEFYSKENGWEPPRGSVVFFSANHPYEDEGHIGISLGGERVIHSLGTVRIETIDEIEENSFIKSYLGWAYPPEGWFSPKISNTFEVGDSVFKKEVWNLRDIPSLYGKKLSTESGNAEIIEDAGTDTDINGICNAGYYWWHIRFGDYDGWCAEKGFLYIELRKDGAKIDEIDVGECFDIYVGDSTDDTGIKEVRFSSDDSQDDNPTGEWTEWYDWDTSSGDWDADTKIKRWAFDTGGEKEVWAEVKDDVGNVGQCHANIFVHPEVVISVTTSGSFLPIYEVILWLDPLSLEIVTAKIADSASQVIEVEVSRGGLPVPGARVFIQEGSFPLGITDENGIAKARYPITHPPKAEDFDFKVHIGAEVDSSIYSSELMTLYSSRLVGATSVEVTEDEAKWYPSHLLLHYLLQPGVPAPKWLLSPVIKMIDQLAKIAADLKDYNPQSGDMLHFKAFEYTASGVETAYAVHLTTERGGAQIYERTQWTDKYELVKPITLFKLAREAFAASLASPANLWITDPNGRHAGIDPQTGELVFEFPMAITAPEEEHQQIVIPEPLDGEYTFGIIGTQEGSYNFICSNIDETGHVSNTFTSTNIPTAPGAVHQYTIDWDALSQGEQGVTVQIDNDGDGVFEQTFTTGNTFQLAQPGISVSKVADPPDVAPSSNVEFTITIPNTGDCTLNPVRVVDTLPAWMSYVSSSPAADTHDGTIIWNNVGPLDPGASETITLVARIASDASGSLTNAVTVTGTFSTGEEVTDSDTVTVTVLAKTIEPPTQTLIDVTTEIKSDGTVIEGEQFGWETGNGDLLNNPPISPGEAVGSIKYDEKMIGSNGTTEFTKNFGVNTNVTPNLAVTKDIGYKSGDMGSLSYDEQVGMRYSGASPPLSSTTKCEAVNAYSKMVVTDVEAATETGVGITETEKRDLHYGINAEGKGSVSAEVDVSVEDGVFGEAPTSSMSYKDKSNAQGGNLSFHKDVGYKSAGMLENVLTTDIKNDGTVNEEEQFRWESNNEYLKYNEKMIGSNGTTEFNKDFGVDTGTAPNLAVTKNIGYKSGDLGSLSYDEQVGMRYSSNTKCEDVNAYGKMVATNAATETEVGITERSLHYGIDAEGKGSVSAGVDAFVEDGRADMMYEDKSNAYGNFSFEKKVGYNKPP